MARHLSRFGVAAVLVVGWVVAAMGPAVAGLTVRVGTYFEMNQFASCPNVPFCTLIFEKSPTDRFFLAKRISCNYTTGAPVTEVMLNNAPGTSPLGAYNRAEFLPVQNVSGASYNVNSEINYLVGLGTYVMVTVFTSATGNFNISCNVVGSLL